VRWRALAPGKVNLCLFLGGPRADGRHELVTVFESVSLADELELTARSSGEDEVICRGVQGPNLVDATLAGLRDRGWSGPPVCVQVSKWIPVAGGMGGGSADAAATIRLAHALSPVAPSTAHDLAVALGADVPSQLAPGVALGTGAGEIIEPVAALAPHAYVIVPLATELSTAAVFAQADRLGLGRDPDELAARRRAVVAALAPGARWPQELLVNDLQPAACSLCPEIERALTGAREAGADGAFVSGSGPTTVAVFWGTGARARAADAEAALAGRYPEAYAADPVTTDFGAPQRV
jgi:4-diphosphocytidyl-2-C-methyl-D-erythritol kinase